MKEIFRKFRNLWARITVGYYWNACMFCGGDFRCRVDIKICYPCTKKHQSAFREIISNEAIKMGVS